MNEKKSIIPIMLPMLDEREIKAVSSAIESGWVSQGPMVKKLEEHFCDYTGAKHASAVSNCTTGLTLALKVVGVSPGDVVITVSHSFIATANSVRTCFAEPFFVDVDQFGNIDAQDLERSLEEFFEARDGGFYLKKSFIEKNGFPEKSHIKRIAPQYLGRLAAVLVVHQTGIACDLGKISQICKNYQVPMVEDAACAIGTEYSVDGGLNWSKVGKPVGELVVFSFHPRKLVTTGDGGMITTDRADYKEKIDLLRQHSMGVSDLKRHGSSEVVFEEYRDEGYNFRLTDVQAAMGIEQMKKLPLILDIRKNLYQIYRRELKDCSQIQFMQFPEYSRSNLQSLIVHFEHQEQKDLMQKMLDQGISTRRGVMSAHLEMSYLGAWKSGPLEMSQKISQECIILPLHHQLTEEVVVEICDALKGIYGL